MDIKLVIVLVTLATLLLILLRLKKSIAVPMLVAFIISAAWTWLYRYEYVGENIFLFGRINVYPLILWTCGLTGLCILQTHIIRRKNFVLLTSVYLIALFALEAVGYYILNIRLASNFPGLWNSGIIHGPAFLKLFYILAGPLYFLTLHFAKHFCRHNN